MDRDEIKSMANAIQKRESDIRAADTPANEARLVALMKSKGAIVKRGKQKGPQRYTLIVPNGRVGPMTLFEIEGIWKKISDERT